MILGKRAGYDQAILGTIQFIMLHVLFYKTDIVSVILCGYEIWCVTSREEHIEGLWEHGGEGSICVRGR
jgi:hypothetical protein